MDLVQEIKAVRFTMAHKGYDCGAVDSYLAKLRGDLSVIELDRKAQEDRIKALEDQLENGGGNTENEETLRRTLLLAQRLADETEADSKAEAKELLDNATAEALTLRETALSDSDQIRENATREAETMVSEAEEAAAELRATVKAETEKARADKRELEKTTKHEAEQSRAETVAKALAVLEAAEATGKERVETIEASAQAEAAEMREPIRAEVEELEQVRSKLQSDISILETHLEAQRARAKGAVEALREGMAGSIDGLERIANDDELLGIEPAPELSGAASADVEAAPDVEIQQRVQDDVGEQPSVDAVEEQALDAMPEVIVEPSEDDDEEDEALTDSLDDSEDSDDQDDNDDSDDDADTAELSDTAVDDDTDEASTETDDEAEQDSEMSVDDVDVEQVDVEEVTVDEVTVEESTVEEMVVEEITVEETVIEEAVVEEAVVEEAVVEEAVVEDASLSDEVEWASPLDDSDEGLGSRSGGLGFGAITGAGAGILAADALSDDGESTSDSGPITEPIPVFGDDGDAGDLAELTEVDELSTSSSSLFGSKVEAEEETMEAMEVEGSAPAGSFVQRFAESLDTLPISRNP